MLAGIDLIDSVLASFDFLVSFDRVIIFIFVLKIESNTALHSLHFLKQRRGRILVQGAETNKSFY